MPDIRETSKLTVRIPMRLLGSVYLAAAKQNRNTDDVVQSALEAWLSEVAGQAQTGQADGTPKLPEATGRKAPREKEASNA